LVPFRFFHSWFELEGFDNFVETTWNDIQIQEPNAMRKLLKKMKYLKEQIRVWIQVKKDRVRNHKKSLKEELTAIDDLLDKGEGTSAILSKRSFVLNSIHEVDKLEEIEVAQKAKIKWAIEGDENSKYYHGVLNQKEANLIYVVFWFDQPNFTRIHLDMEFHNKLSLEQQAYLECNVTHDEIKRAVWDCGIDKSPGPDEFTFGFYRRYWNSIENDVVEAVYYFFQYGEFPKGCNPCFML
ncbi:hypothetical protein Tco_1572992, partial [Tanacetum coccineum]